MLSEQDTQKAAISTQFTVFMPQLKHPRALECCLGFPREFMQQHLLYGDSNCILL